MLVLLYVKISRALVLLTLYLIHVGRAWKAVLLELINGRDPVVEEPIRGDPTEVNRPVVAPRISYDLFRRIIINVLRSIIIAQYSSA